MSRALFIVALGFSVLVSSSYCQSFPPHHHAAADTIVDGAIHPEMIPDSIAYRLYFVTVAIEPDATDEDRARQQSHLRKTGLPASDVAIIKDVLTEFRTAYDILVAQYNQSAQAAEARNEIPDIAGFFRQLDGLVLNTRDKLKLRLTPGALSQFESFVQSEKKHMKVHLEAQ
jgi:hypothetical protein